MEPTNTQGRLFDGEDAATDRKTGLKVRINFDGASKGNPGPASIGAVIAERPGEILVEISEAIGKATSNFAEYSALVRALEEAVRLGATEVECVSDSELVVRQMTGVYRVRNESLKPLWQKARDLSGKFGRFSIRHVPRAENRRADKLASHALKKKKGRT